MRRPQVLAFLAGAAAVCGGGPLAVACAVGGGAGPAAGGAAVPAVRAVGSWVRAIEVPGLAALNKGGDANVTSVSCPPPGKLRGRRLLHGQPRSLPGIRDLGRQAHPPSPLRRPLPRHSAQADLNAPGVAQHAHRQAGPPNQTFRVSRPAKPIRIAGIRNRRSARCDESACVHAP